MVPELVVEVDPIEMEPAHARALAGEVDRLLPERPRRAMALEHVEAPLAVLDVHLGMEPEVLDGILWELDRKSVV